VTAHSTRAVEIRSLGSYDLRRFPTGLDGDPLQIGLAGIDHHQLADFGRAGEADLVDIHMQRQRLADGAAGAMDDIETPSGPSASTNNCASKVAEGAIAAPALASPSSPPPAPA